MMVFEQAMRTKLMADVLAAVSRHHGLERPTILEVGASIVSQLESFLPQADITLSDHTMEPEKEYPRNFRLLDMTDMRDVPDNHYDFVAASAVLEHIPPSRRERAVLEAIRVSRVGFFCSFPFQSPHAARGEANSRRLYELLTGRPHKWLLEHMANGLPDIGWLEGLLKTGAFGYHIFQQGDIDLWEALYSVYIRSLSLPAAWRSHLTEWYLENLYCQDRSDQNLIANVYVAKLDAESLEAVCRVTDGICPLQDKPAALAEVRAMEARYALAALDQKIQRIEVTAQRRHTDLTRMVARVDEKALRVEENTAHLRWQTEKAGLCRFLHTLLQRQDTIWLFGITRKLAQVANHCARRLPNTPVCVLDSYRAGRLSDFDLPADHEIFQPDAALLRGQTVLVFPDNRHGEIFALLEQMDARPVFYRDVLDGDLTAWPGEG